MTLTPVDWSIMSSDYSPSPSPEPGDIFLEAFRRHAAGISVITLRQADGSPTGFTATSVASLAADPPMATFNMATTSSSWSAVEATDHLLIHILGTKNLSLAKKFADIKEARFLGITVQDGPEGLPLLPGASGYLVGKIIDRVVHHDAATVIVEIVGGGLGEPDTGLTYHGRDYASALAVS
jgi:flavin reductase (DIM6/NTAB) family NADH-FMN oxidoreductase RutF